MTQSKRGIIGINTNNKKGLSHAGSKTIQKNGEKMKSTLTARLEKQSKQVKMVADQSQIADSKSRTPSLTCKKCKLGTVSILVSIVEAVCLFVIELVQGELNWTSMVIGIIILLEVLFIRDIIKRNVGNFLDEWCIAKEFQILNAIFCLFAIFFAINGILGCVFYGKIIEKMIFLLIAECLVLIIVFVSVIWVHIQNLNDSKCTVIKTPSTFSIIDTQISAPISQLQRITNNNLLYPNHRANKTSKQTAPTNQSCPSCRDNTCNTHNTYNACTNHKYANGNNAGTPPPKATHRSENTDAGTNATLTDMNVQARSTELQIQHYGRNATPYIVSSETSSTTTAGTTGTGAADNDHDSTTCTNFVPLTLSPNTASNSLQLAIIKPGLSFTCTNTNTYTNTNNTTTLSDKMRVENVTTDAYTNQFQLNKMVYISDHEMEESKSMTTQTVKYDPQSMQITTENLYQFFDVSFDISNDYQNVQRDFKLFIDHCVRELTLENLLFWVNCVQLLQLMVRFDYVTMDNISGHLNLPIFPLNLKYQTQHHVKSTPLMQSLKLAYLRSTVENSNKAKFKQESQSYSENETSSQGPNYNIFRRYYIELYYKFIARGYAAFEVNIDDQLRESFANVYQSLKHGQKCVIDKQFFEQHIWCLILQAAKTVEEYLLVSFYRFKSKYASMK